MNLENRSIHIGGNLPVLRGWRNRTKGPHDMDCLRRHIAELEADEGGGS